MTTTTASDTLTEALDALEAAPCTCSYSTPKGRNQILVKTCERCRVLRKHRRQIL